MRCCNISTSFILSTSPTMIVIRTQLKHISPSEILRRSSPRSSLQNVTKLKLAVRLNADETMHRTWTPRRLYNLDELATTLKRHAIITTAHKILVPAIVVLGQMISVHRQRNIQIMFRHHINNPRRESQRDNHTAHRGNIRDTRGRRWCRAGRARNAPHPRECNQRPSTS